MGYWDAMTSNLFGEDNDGRRTYSPNGKRGKTYLVPDDRAAKIEKTLRRSFQLMIGTIFVGQVTMGWPGALGAGVVMFIFYMVQANRHLEGLEVVSNDSIRKTTAAERMEKGSRQMGVPMLLLMLFFSLLFVVGGVFLLSKGEEPLAAWGSIGFFGLCAIVFLVQLWFALRPSTGDKNASSAES